MHNVGLRDWRSTVRFNDETLTASNPAGQLGRVIAGSRNSPPTWRSNGQTFVHGSVQVERQFSKACVDGVFRGESQHLPFDRGFHRGVIFPWSMEVQEETEVSSCE
jgi:hypothetical protein